MPRSPIYTTVPTLPLFLRDTTDDVFNALNKRLNLEKYFSGPHMTSEEGRKVTKRKAKRRCSSANQLYEERKSPSREDGYPHASSPDCNRHHHRKNKLHKVMVHASPEGVSSPPQEKPKCTGEPETSESLVKEVKRLTVVNQLAPEAVCQASEHSCQHEMVLQGKDEQIASLRAQLAQYERHKRDLERQRDALRSRLETAAATSRPQVAVASTQVTGSSEDVTLLQELVVRLNAELERYQQRLSALGATPGTGRHQPPPGVPPEAWDKLNRSLLGPLLEAYSETIHEKDDLVQKYEKELVDLRTHCRGLVTENEQLFSELEEMNRKLNDAMAEVKVLQQDSTLVQEQNELLTGQLDVQRQKLQEVHAAYQQKVSSMTRDMEEVCQKYHTCRGELLTLRGQHSVLREEFDRLKADAESRVPLPAHTAAVSECRRLFEELRSKYEGDRQSLQQLEGDRARAQARVAQLESALREMESQLETLKADLSATKAARDAARRQLGRATRFAEELLVEQETLSAQLRHKVAETRSVAQLGSAIVTRMGSLRDKLKTVQQGAWQELDQVERRIRQQEEGVAAMKRDYHCELARLRTLLQHKEAIIGQLQLEKSKAEESLEAVWRNPQLDSAPRDSLKHVNFSPDERHAPDEVDS